LWCNAQPSASGTGSGFIYRLPLALIRNWGHNATKIRQSNTGI
jgi:ABC-type uncharacterized transport system YnjBCD substrate-binding protein